MVSEEEKRDVRVEEWIAPDGTKYYYYRFSTPFGEDYVFQVWQKDGITFAKEIVDHNIYWGKYFREQMRKKLCDMLKTTVKFVPDKWLPISHRSIAGAEIEKVMEKAGATEDEIIATLVEFAKVRGNYQMDLFVRQVKEKWKERNPIGKVKTYEGRGTVHLTVAPKERFKKFRTQDIGRPGHTMRVAGIDKRTGKWATQKYIFRKDDVVVVGGKIYPKNPRTARTLKQIADRHPRVRRKLASELLSGY
jgi:hypothetical protein